MAAADLPAVAVRLRAMASSNCGGSSPGGRGVPPVVKSVTTPRSSALVSFRNEHTTASDRRRSATRSEVWCVLTAHATTKATNRITKDHVARRRRMAFFTRVNGLPVGARPEARERSGRPRCRSSSPCPVPTVGAPSSIVSLVGPQSQRQAEGGQACEQIHRPFRSGSQYLVQEPVGPEDEDRHVPKDGGKLLREPGGSALGCGACHALARRDRSTSSSLRRIRVSSGACPLTLPLRPIAG